MPEAKMQPALTPRIESRKSILIAGSQRHYTDQNVSEISSQWRSLPFGRIPSQVGRKAYGVALNCVEGACDFDYLAGAEVSSFAGLPADFARMSLPAQKYAIFTHRDHISKLKDTLGVLARTWLPTARDVLASPRSGEAQVIEYYGEDFDLQTGMGTIEVWFPAK